VEFPCGGRGRCKGCRVRVIEGQLPVTVAEERMLTRDEILAGWRLSCQCRAEADLTLELAQWEASILADETQFAFVPREGLGVAVDLGTTTIVAQLLDMQSGDVLAVRTALNPQARFGADIMSRISFAMDGAGHEKLGAAVRAQVGKMISELLDGANRGGETPRDIVIVGNTVMHHLFSGLDVEPLSRYPFESTNTGTREFGASELDWPFPPHTRIRFLPCIGSFVGSDALAGVWATGIRDSQNLVALVDLGTNGEIVVGNRRRLVCSSTAAGPAFEGARISMGMRAATGAVSEVHLGSGRPECSVIGNVAPRGICGSGLVDAVAVWLDLAFILPNGRTADGRPRLDLCPPVSVSQADIRELQLAKGAIAAGLRMLLETIGAAPSDLSQIYLAGAFGNYVNTTSAVRIGLIRFPVERIEPVGNSALRGAKMALFSDDRSWETLAAGIEHVSLHANPHFQDIYVDEMSFPQGDLEPGPGR
jgi:uncharacterized 2Fe-2S/4Fe-4S cluster protein (DUF4445 family)